MRFVKPHRSPKLLEETRPQIDRGDLHEGCFDDAAIGQLVDASGHHNWYRSKGRGQLRIVDRGKVPSLYVQVRHDA